MAKRCGSVLKRVANARPDALMSLKRGLLAGLLRDTEEPPMPSKAKSLDTQQPIELTTDFLGEDRHEFVAKLAYKLWEERGRPWGSPEVDWFAAERAMYSALLASGLVGSAIAPEHLAEKIYR